MSSEDKQKELAIALHKHFCERDHTEHCGWYYEKGYKNTWDKYEHRKWLDRARHVIKGSNNNIEQILNAMNVINEVRKLLGT
jgi:hypothetical protein